MKIHKSQEKMVVPEQSKYKSLTTTPDSFGAEVEAAEAEGYELLGSPRFSGGDPGVALVVSVMMIRRPVSLNVHRFKENPQEKAFATAWEDMDCFRRDGCGTLQYMMCPPRYDHRYPPVISDRDRLVAATVIQWLGSPVGLCFLRDLGFVNKGVN